MHAGIGIVDNKGNHKKQLPVVDTKTHKQKRSIRGRPWLVRALQQKKHPRRAYAATVWLFPRLRQDHVHERECSIQR